MRMQDFRPTRKDPNTALALATRVAAITCLLTLAIVFIERGISAWLAAHLVPGVAVTSGFEEESWYALWRATHGQPVYFDGTTPPFSAAYFNWLFYMAYALPARIARYAAEGVGLIATARMLTALAAIFGVVVLTRLLRQTLGGHTLTATTLAGLVFGGPLVGWWAHTVRPDVAALALEVAAIALLLRRYRTAPIQTAIGTALLCYAAWSFKQTYVLGLGTAVVFLLSRRQWAASVTLIGLTLSLWTVTLAALGAEYRSALVGGAVNSRYFLALGWDNFRDFAVKGLPLGLVALAALRGRGAKSAADVSMLANDLRRFGMIGVAVTVPLAFAASCKLGASSYYYFTTLVMLSLLATSGLASRDGAALRLAAFTLATAMQLVLLLGPGQHTTIMPAARDLAETWAMWREQPEPRFSHLTAFNLPWLSPASPPLVLAFNYSLDRAAGRAFTDGGLGGMIAAGRFRALLLPSAVTTVYDGAVLMAYTRGRAANGLTIFHPTSTP